mgnify:CR=1 FL=1
MDNLEKLYRDEVKSLIDSFELRVENEALELKKDAIKIAKLCCYMLVFNIGYMLDYFGFFSFNTAENGIIISVVVLGAAVILGVIVLYSLAAFNVRVLYFEFMSNINKVLDGEKDVYAYSFSSLIYESREIAKLKSPAVSFAKPSIGCVVFYMFVLFLGINFKHIAGDLPIGIVGIASAVCLFVVASVALLPERKMKVELHKLAVDIDVQREIKED